jgi:hypothetical protein
MDQSFTLGKNFLFLLRDVLSPTDGAGQFYVIMAERVLTQNSVVVCVGACVDTDACAGT